MRKLAIVSALLAACGSVESALSPSDAGAGATIDAAVTDGGVVPEGVSKIVVAAKGGGPLPPAPDGSTCHATNATYTIGLPNRDLSWNLCARDDGGPYFVRTGQKALSASEYAPIDTAVHALERTSTPVCGFDKWKADITFTTPSATVVYYDDFYFCDASDSKPYVKGIDAVIQAIDPHTR